jgi:hypothetical protein
MDFTSLVTPGEVQGSYPTLRQAGSGCVPRSKNRMIAMTRTQRLLTLLMLCVVLPAFAQTETKPDVILRGELSGKDHQTWRLVPFDVPAGTARITVEFDYTGRDERTTIDLGVIGPDGFRGQDGFRGWSGGNKRSFAISATDATPSYLPGPIRAGQWNLLLGIPNIRSETRAEYTAAIRFTREDESLIPTLQAEPPLRSGPGWFRGDLHMHTAHSDGTCASQSGARVPCPLFLTAKTAAERGLDFIAITDHNTTSQANSIREIQPFFDRLLLIPGREVTTFQGHANLFGSLAPIDFRVVDPQVPDWNTLLKQVAREGGVISINHPVRPSGEQCMGCGWTPQPDVDYSLMQAVEVVNGLDADTPFSGIGFWQELLNRGYRLTAIGGSDNHNALQPAVDFNTLFSALGQASDSKTLSAETIARLQRSSGAIGTPTTVVYAEALSKAAIIEAIRRGRVFIDVAGSHTRAMDLSVRTGKQTAYMGETLPAARGAMLQFESLVTDVVGGRVEVVMDGRPAALLSDNHVATAAQTFRFQWRGDGERHWLRVDVRDAQDRLVLIGNPIYIARN